MTGRNPARLPAELAAAGARFVAADRADDRQLRAALGEGADLLVDCICFTAADATRLLPLARDAGSTVLISSKAVYVDAAGNHSNSDTAPRFDGPIRETQPTMAPGDGDYDSREGYGANKVAAEQVLLDSGLPVTVLRPSKIHGAGAARPREWVFVKRVLDRRPAVFLARRGSGVDHTTAAANIAALIETVAARPGAADPEQRRSGRAERARDLTHDRPAARARVEGGAARRGRRRARADSVGRAASDRARRDRRRSSSATSPPATTPPRWSRRSSGSSRRRAPVSACPAATTRSSRRCSTTRPRTATRCSDRSPRRPADCDARC